MKKYIQLTAGRGPVECARAVTLVARELLKDFPDAELIECEPHNTEPDCYMSMLFLAEVSPAKEQAWSGTVLWRATSDRYRPGHSRFRKCRIRTLCMKPCVPAGTEGRMSTKSKRLSTPLIFLPEFPSNAAPGGRSRRTRKRHAVSCL